MLTVFGINNLMCEENMNAVILRKALTKIGLHFTKLDCKHQ